MKGACPGGSSQTLVAPHRPTRPSEFGSKSSTLLVEGWGTGSGAGRLGDLTHSPDSQPGRDFSCPHRAPAEKPGEPPPFSPAPPLPVSGPLQPSPRRAESIHLADSPPTNPSTSVFTDLLLPSCLLSPPSLAPSLLLGSSAVICSIRASCWMGVGRALCLRRQETLSSVTLPEAF